MKKLLYFFATLLCSGVITTANAQQTTWGLRGGLNISNVTENEFNFGSRTSFIIGTYLNYRFPKSAFSLQPELLYSKKGYRDGLTIELDYIEVPILAKFQFQTRSAVTPNIYAGPYIGFMVNAETDEPSDSIFSYNIEDSIDDSPQLGIAAGAGLNIGRFSVGVRYTRGLTNLTREPGVFLNHYSRNHAVSITTGITF